VEGIMKKLNTSAGGIDENSIGERIDLYGENKFPEPETKSFLRIFFEV
jgi:hypothetical protein